MAAGILEPSSLTFLFKQSISSGIVPTKWKPARVTLIFKKGLWQDIYNYKSFSVIPVAKVSEE